MELQTIGRVSRQLLNLGKEEDTLFNDENLMEIVDSLTVSKINFKVEKSMTDLNQASEKLNRLTDKDVRIVYIPVDAMLKSVHII